MSVLPDRLLCWIPTRDMLAHHLRGQICYSSVARPVRKVKKMVEHVTAMQSLT